MIPDVRYSHLHAHLFLADRHRRRGAGDELTARCDGRRGYGASFALFFAALRHGAPLAESYAVWAGLGVAATAVVGWLVFSERMSFAVITGIGLVVSGVLLIELCGRGGHS